MHFVSAQSEQEQLRDILTYLKDNFENSLESGSHKAAASSGFAAKLQAFEDKKDYSGVLDYLLDCRDDLHQLPTSHKKSNLTI